MTEEDYKLKKIANRFIRRNRIDKIYSDCVSELIIKAYITAYKLAKHREKTDLQSQLAEKNKEIEELIKENEEMKSGLGCETCQIHLEFMNLNKQIEELKHDNDKLKDLNEGLKQERIEAIYRNNELEEHHKKVCEQLTQTHRSIGEENRKLQTQIYEMRNCQNCCHCGGYTDEAGNSVCDSCDDDMLMWEY